MQNRVDREREIGDLLALYRRRRVLFCLIILATLLSTAVYCVFATRRYQAVGEVEVKDDDALAMGLDSVIVESGGQHAAGDLTINVALQTQASVLQSDTVALQAIHDLHLENDGDFRMRGNLQEWFEGLLGIHDQETPGVPLLESPKWRRHALKVFSHNLSIRPQEGTRLIEIAYSDPDPRIAAVVVDRLIQLLTDYNYQSRFTATDQASKWLESQLGGLRQQTADLQLKAINLQRETGVIAFGTTDLQGKVQAFSDVLGPLQQSTISLNQASALRILKGAIANYADTHDPESLSGIAGNEVIGTGAANTLAHIQDLHMLLASEQGQLDQAETRYGASYPGLNQLKSGIASTQDALQQARVQLRQRADSDFSIAEETQNQVRQKYDLARKAADKTNDKVSEYEIALHEAEASTEIYASLLQRLVAAGVLEGIQSTRIRTVEHARLFPQPLEPRVQLYMGMALGGGLLMACFGTLLFERLDTKINTVIDAEDMLEGNLLGVIPQFEASPPASAAAPPKPRRPILLEAPHSTFAEAMRAVRTSVLLAHSDSPPQLILVTSSVAGEGKTTFSVNLATVLALQGHRVLVVDTDLRRGTLSRQFGVNRGGGLSSLLSGQISVPPIQQSPDVPNLSILTGGINPPNPSELLSSSTMARWLATWREQYDSIILDGAPVLPVSDAMILSAWADLSILLLRSGLTDRDQFMNSYFMLTSRTKHSIGVVLNGINAHDRSYYGYYGYRGYRENAYSDSGEEK